MNYRKRGNTIMEKVKKLSGANMDIDLTSNGKISWEQVECPWNQAEKTDVHKCAVKNTSICGFFCGIEYHDKVLCCYPNDNPNRRE
jgi:hypothetical protein